MFLDREATVARACATASSSARAQAKPLGAAGAAAFFAFGNALRIGLASSAPQLLEVVPKGVLLEQRAEMLNVYHILMTIDINRDSISLMQTPMFHAASMGPLLAAPAVAATSTFVPVFNPEQVLDVIERDRVTARAQRSAQACNAAIARVRPVQGQHDRER